MNTQTISVLTKERSRNQITEQLSEEATSLLQLGRQNNWDVAVLGFAPMPTQPVHLGEWMLSPAHLDTSKLPDRTWKRVQAIYAAGLRPKGFVMVHETPKLLYAPKVDRKPRLSWDDVAARLRDVSQVVVSTTNKAAPVVWEVTKAIGKVAVAAATVTAIGAFAFLGLAIAAMAADPILVAVTDDDCWIEIDRWLVE